MSLDVTSSGAVLLGDSVVCDGFQRGRASRVQTHVHDDHMHDFERSKGLQNLYMSEATRRLLIAEFNYDLEHRENIVAVPPDKSATCAGGRLTLVPNGHMLGAVQVALETTEGQRLGYSGDFRWPMDKVIQVDALVIDSTYGSEASVRKYSQEQAETSFLRLVLQQLRKGAVHVKAHRGTVQRAMQILAGNVGVPFVASEGLCREVAVYQQFGCAICELVAHNTEAGRRAVSEGRYVRFYSKGDRTPVEFADGTKIVLSAFMNLTSDPVIEYSDRGYSVALSNHADFNGTLEYISATGAKRVVTDNTRGHGIELALAVKQRLGIEARPSSNLESREWGVG